ELLRAPGESQHTAGISILDGDGESFHVRDIGHLERHAYEILGRVVYGSPLARLPVEDQLVPALWRGARPERVLTGWYRRTRDNEIGARGELRGGVCARTPDGVAEDAVLPHVAAARRRTAVIHRHGRAANGGARCVAR